jgi:hypothetical protein
MPKGDFPMSEPSLPRSKKLLDQLDDVIRIKHYGYSTEKTYVQAAKRYIAVCDSVLATALPPKTLRLVPLVRKSFSVEISSSFVP